MLPGVVACRQAQSVLTCPPMSPDPTMTNSTSAAITAWLFAQIFVLGSLAILGWLLARLVWLYYFFGLFFFLVAGLLVGAIGFRIARSARPMAKSRLLRGIISIALCSTAINIVWEYRHFCSTVGQPPHFADARNAAIALGKPSNQIQHEASEEFARFLTKEFPPGGALGYMLWSTREGKARITVEGVGETIVTDHRQWIWPVRTFAGLAMLIAGLWFSMESLCSPLPVSNVLQPGEEYVEEV